MRLRSERGVVRFFVYACLFVETRVRFFVFDLRRRRRQHQQQHHHTPPVVMHTQHNLRLAADGLLFALPGYCCTAVPQKESMACTSNACGYTAVPACCRISINTSSNGP
ncbi:unnamed protein product, partial [Ectocarpus fasciculatus]